MDRILSGMYSRVIISFGLEDHQRAIVHRSEFGVGRTSCVAQWHSAFLMCEALVLTSSTAQAGRGVYTSMCGLAFHAYSVFPEVTLCNNSDSTRPTNKGIGKVWPMASPTCHLF